MQSRRRPHTRLLRCEHSQPRTESNVHVEEERLTALPMKIGGDQNPRTPWTPSRGPVLWSALRPPCSSAGPRCPAGRWGGPRSGSLAWGAVAERAQRQLLTQHVAQGLQEQQVGRTERPDGAWPAQLWGRGLGVRAGTETSQPGLSGRSPMLARAVSSPQPTRTTLSIQEKVLECEPGCTALCLANLQSALPQAEGSRQHSRIRRRLEQTRHSR